MDRSNKSIDRARSGDIRAVLDGIRRIVRVLRLSDRAAEKEAGLSGAQLFVLQRLADEPAISLNELGQRTHTHQSSVSTVVQRLVERRLVRRVRSRTDARRLRLTLTPRGRSVVRHAPQAAQERLVAALGHLPASDRPVLAKLLGALATKIGAETGVPPAMLFEEDAAARRATLAKRRAPARLQPGKRSA